MQQHTHHIASALNDVILPDYCDTIEYRDKMWNDNRSSEIHYRPSLGAAHRNDCL